MAPSSRRAIFGPIAWLLHPSSTFESFAVSPIWIPSHLLLGQNGWLSNRASPQSRPRGAMSDSPNGQPSSVPSAASPAAARRARRSTNARNASSSTGGVSSLWAMPGASATLGARRREAVHRCDAPDVHGRALRADPGEALTDAGPEGIDPGSMLLCDLGTLQNAKYIDPFLGNTGIDSREGTPDRYYSQRKRLRDLRPGIRKRISRNQTTRLH
jgi:hypothetical protein